MSTSLLDIEKDFDKIRKKMSNLFDENFFDSFGDEFDFDFKIPEVNFSETDSELVYNLDVPDMDKEDIKLEVKDGFLLMSAEKKSESEEGKKGEEGYKSSSKYNSFYRSIFLPSTVDSENVKASYKDGVLEVHLPKSEKAEGKKLIKID